MAMYDHRWMTGELDLPQPAFEPPAEKRRIVLPILGGLLATAMLAGCVLAGVVGVHGLQ